MSAGDGILCPVCGGDTGVVETRQNRGSIRRRRRCLRGDCRGRLTTAELPAPRFSKRTVVEGLIAMPRVDSVDFEMVPRRLMATLREMVATHDGGRLVAEAVDEHW